MSKQIVPHFIFTCGSGEYGQTTEINDSCFLIPIQSEESQFKHYDIQFIKCGSWNSFAYLKNGKLFSWGLLNSFNHLKIENNFSLIPIDFNIEIKNIKKISLGDYHLIILNNEGKVFFYGNSFELIKTDEIIIDIYAKFTKSVLITINGNIIISEPLKNQIIFKEEEYLNISLTETQIGILTKNGLKIYNELNEFYFISNVILVESNRDKFLILMKNSLIYEIYKNGIKKQIYGIIGIPINIFSGNNHFGVITLEGDCWTWGNGLKGQLGTGIFLNSNLPKKIIIKEGYKIVSGCGGENHSIFLSIKEGSYNMKIPEKMKLDDYIQIIRTKYLLNDQYLPSQLDMKF